MATLSIYEVLELAARKRHKEQKIEVLQQNESWALKDVLRGTYDNNVRWNLPVGTPPFTPAPEYSHPANLLRENTKFQYFLVGGPDMQGFKRESLFIGVLEGVHPKDAEIVINMVNKKAIEGISKPIVEEAFPDLIQDSE
jgi:hypothetical protein|tara:strand:- start:1073 stop:1492 length:420 start_codon:yes stop_codon:yes gene_type:complete